MNCVHSLATLRLFSFTKCSNLTSICSASNLHTSSSPITRITNCTYSALSAAIKADDTQQTVMSGSFTKAGMLFVPRRGYLKVFEGDWVGVDSRGWPILLSADTIASGPWTHS